MRGNRMVIWHTRAYWKPGDTVRSIYNVERYSNMFPRSHARVCVKNMNLSVPPPLCVCIIVRILVIIYFYFTLSHNQPPTIDGVTRTRTEMPKRLNATKTQTHTHYGSRGNVDVLVIHSVIIAFLLLRDMRTLFKSDDETFF